MGLEPVEESASHPADLLDFSDLEDDSADDSDLDTLSGEDLLDFDSLDEEDVTLDESELDVPESPVVPQMDSPAVPSFDEGSPAIPQMDSPAVPSFDEGSPTVPQMDSPSVPSFDESSPSVPSFESSTQEIQIPSFDEEFKSEERTMEEERTEAIDRVDLHKLGVKKNIWLFVAQYTYWFFIFFIINVASIKVLVPTVRLDNLIQTMITPTTSSLGEQIYEFSAIQISPVFFLFSWMSYIPMGWFYRYKLEQYKVAKKWYHPLGFLLGFIFFSVGPAIAVLSITDSIIPILYFFLIPGEIFITLFTMGIGTFYLGYLVLYDYFYEMTPISKLPHQNLE